MSVEPSPSLGYVLRVKHLPTREQAAATLLTRCRDRGAKVTPQRTAVYAAVAGTDCHPAPEEVFRAVREEMPQLSLATIYKVLDFLEDMDLVRRVASEGSGRRYDANLEPHHHLVCEECGGIEDFVDARLDEVRPKRRLGGFRAERISVQIHGTCASCASAE